MDEKSPLPPPAPARHTGTPNSTPSAHTPVASRQSRRLVAWVRRSVWLSPMMSIWALLGITLFIYVQVKPFSTGWAASINLPKRPRTHGLADLTSLLWGSSAILFLVVTAAAALVLTVTIFRSLRDHALSGSIASTLAQFGAGLLILAALGLASAGPLGNSRYVTSEILDRAVPKVMGTVELLWAVTLTAAFLLVAGACACLLDIHRGPAGASVSDAEKHQELAAALNVQSRRLQSVLFAGAAVLVAGVVEVDSLYHWALSLTNLSKEEAAAVTSSATVPTGTFFSLFLAAAYLPAALILRERGMALARSALPLDGPAAHGQWLQNNGLGISITSQVTSLLALLGPVLAGGPLNAFAHALG